MTMPQIVRFGPDEFGCVGWLHPAAPGRRPGLGLVVCNPFGFEEVCAHRSLRHLAAEAAATGIPSLRFDYPGCGNAAGDVRDPDLVARWVRSVQAAIERLRSESGVAHVVLAGVRVGAAIAALAAAEREDVAGLIAIAPVERGRDYLRELRLLGHATSDGALETAGFILGASAVDMISRIDLCADAKSPAPRVLIVERDDLPLPRRWHGVLAAHGVATETAEWPGYAALMTNPQDAKLPVAIVTGVLATIAEWQTGVKGGTVPRPVPSAPAVAPDAEWRVGIVRGDDPVEIVERMVSIDLGGSTMFGVQSRRIDAPREPGAKRRGVVLLNSGAVYHIGPNRLWVTLARRWAARGIAVLRVDLSGIGESPARLGGTENRVYSVEAADDIAAALRWLREQGIEDCKVVGLCSGAFHALNAAVAGQAISAAIMINPLTYSWEDSGRLGNALNEYEILELSLKYRRQFLDFRTWRRLVRRELDLKTIAGVIVQRARRSARSLLSACRRGIAPDRGGGLAGRLLAAGRHGIRLHFVFAAGAPGRELLTRDAHATVDGLLRKGLLSLDSVADADHTFTRDEARMRLIDTLDRLVLAPSRLASALPTFGSAAAPVSTEDVSGAALKLPDRAGCVP